MQRHRLIYISLAFGILLLFLFSCNPTKDRKINRAWHTLTGHYNVYFNGEQKILAIFESLDAGTINDFTKFLPIFNYGTEASAKSIGGQLDEVLKKASLSIQNHTVGQYTDDSYLLMGKAHFLKRDYYAAIEAFQYLNSKYKDKGLRPISTVWIAKSYSGLKKNEEAEAIIGLLLSEFGPKVSKGKPVKPTFKQKWFPEYPDEFYRELYATAADIAIKQEKFHPATIYLEHTLKYTHKKQQRIRYSYVLGQLYLHEDSVKQANKLFKSILASNAPYDFEFNASINIARAYDPKDRAAVKRVRKSLKRMLKDDKNDGMYDQIYYELGNLEFKEHNTNEAIKYYKLSVGKSVNNPNQKALSYLALGNIFLAMPDYPLAQAYYDSTAGSLSKDYKDFAKIIAKKELLSELIDNLVVIETEDSLQAISKLSNKELELKIDSWILAQKNANIQQAKEKQRQKALAKMAEQNQQNIPTPSLSTGFGTGEAGAWYFYNPSLIAAGSADFFSQRKWGRRANDDFWRLSNKEKEQSADETGAVKQDTLANEVTDDGNEPPVKGETKLPEMSNDRQAWIANVPFEESELQKSNTKILDAYYNIGVLYDEKLLDFKESAKEFEKMNERFPGNAYEPEVLYRLYKIYLFQKDSGRANYAKANLITKYPESPYALILQNKTLKSAETDSNKEIVAHYELTYSYFISGDYNQVKRMKKEADKAYPGNSLQPKYDLLYALSVGKTDSLSAFKSELELLTKLYPGTDVGERATVILAYIKKKETASRKDSVVVAAEPDFKMEPALPHYFIFATKDEKIDNNELLSGFNKYNEEFSSFENLRVNNYVSPEGYQMIMVREFSDLKKSLDYMKGIQVLDIIKSQIKFSGKYIIFVVSAGNFKKLLKEQKLDSYFGFFTEYQTKNAPKQ